MLKYVIGLLLVLLCVYAQQDACSTTNCGSLPCCNGACYSASVYVCTAQNRLCPVDYPRSCGDACYSPAVYKCVDSVLVPGGEEEEPETSHEPEETEEHVEESVSLEESEEQPVASSTANEEEPEMSQSTPEESEEHTPESSEDEGEEDNCQPPQVVTCSRCNGAPCCSNVCYSTNVHVCTRSGQLCPVTAPRSCSGACYDPNIFSCVDGVLTAGREDSCPNIPNPPAPSPPTPPPTPPTSDPEDIPSPPAGWRVVFEDEFSGSDLNRSLWDYGADTGCPSDCGTGNDYKHTFRNSSVSVRDGVMRIDARRVPGTDRWDSGMIWARDTFPLLYGRIDTRMRFQKGNGPFAGCNFIAKDNVYGGWPLSGEINIVKYSAGWNDHSTHSIHFSQFIDRKLYNPNVDQFQEYSLIWDPDRISLLHEGSEILSYDRPGTGGAVWPFDQEFFLFYDLSIGWAGGPQPSPSDNHFFMEVDWVRISKRE